MPGSDGLRILGDFWKKQLVEIRTWAKRVDFWASARPGQLGLRDAPRVVGSDGTVSIVKIVSLFPSVENLKVKKVIKVSYLNQESRRVIRDSYACERSTYRYISHICIMAILQLFWMKFSTHSTIDFRPETRPYRVERKITMTTSLQSGKSLPTNILYTTLNSLMASLREGGVALNGHRS